jgi:hypothetical protein
VGIAGIEVVSACKDELVQLVWCCGGDAENAVVVVVDRVAGQQKCVLRRGRKFLKA